MCSSVALFVSLQLQEELAVEEGMMEERERFYMRRAVKTYEDNVVLAYGGHCFIRGFCCC